MDISMIRTEIDKDIVRKKSSKTPGRGTMIIASISTIIKTTLKSFTFKRGAIYGDITSKKRFFLDFSAKLVT